MSADGFLYSVRMRASNPEGRHVSGAERLVTAAEVPAVGSELLGRALSRSEIGQARVSVDRRSRDHVRHIPCLPVIQIADPERRRAALDRALREAEVAPAFFRWALESLASGQGLEGGAALVGPDCRALHPDAERGVRSRHFDYSPAAREAVRQALEAAGLGHFRTFEALALASKVAWSGVALEICWSDEPDYLTGYVASPRFGYLRMPDWKPEGAPGGRVFLLDPRVDPAECVRRLEEEWTLIEAPIEVRAEL